jgi:RNA polymerase sigma-70 factor (family 1)
LSAPLHNENELLALVNKSDEAAFRKLYNFYQRKIFALAYTLTESLPLTEDVVQETFIKVWDNRSKLPDINKFHAYLRTITKNLIIDALKKQAKENVRNQTISYFTKDFGNYTDDIIFSRENEKILQRAIELLSPQQRVVYSLRKEGLRNAEIATRLNISILTVKNHLISAMRIIRTYFRQHLPIILIAALIFT